MFWGMLKELSTLAMVPVRWTFLTWILFGLTLIFDWSVSCAKVFIDASIVGA